MSTACDQRPTNYYPLDVDRRWHYTIERTTMDGTVTQKYLTQTLPYQNWNGIRIVAKNTVSDHRYYYRIDGDGVRRVARKLRTDKHIQAVDPSHIVLPADIRSGATWQRSTQTIVLENAGPPWETPFRITQTVILDYTIESVTDVVHVPAGEFHDCLRVVGSGLIDAEIGNYIGRTVISVTVTEWYAPNVGLVRLQRIETTDAEALNYGALKMELESYH